MRLSSVVVSRRSVLFAISAAIASVSLQPVSGQESRDYIPPDSTDDLSGKFEADGSSTLGPLTEAAIEDFFRIVPEIRITNGVSGTGGGFERFAKGEITIANASRQITQAEAERCTANGIEWYQFAMAYDGIVVAVSADNDFVESLTVDELQKIWNADSGVSVWSGIDPAFPAEPIELYGAGTASGTFDYFNEAILGEDLDVRTDYMPSEDDNVLVQGVAGSLYALGYFGFSYYEENQDILKALAIDSGNGPVQPGTYTIADGSYQPLARSLYIYVNARDLQNRPEVGEFVKFYAAMAHELVPDVGYIARSPKDEQMTYRKVLGAIEGTVQPDSQLVSATPEASATLRFKVGDQDAAHHKCRTRLHV